MHSTFIVVVYDQRHAFSVYPIKTVLTVKMGLAEQERRGRRLSLLIRSAGTPEEAKDEVQAAHPRHHHVSDVTLGQT
jgi:hypothetical protein